MHMSMVLIVFMLVTVLKRLMRMFMLVRFGQVQPNTDAH